MGKIRELPKSSSRLLTSSQIITSVYCVVKELIENALDSASKNIEVKLEEYGLEKIEVKDNGDGIDKNDIEFVAKPHFTSKITSCSDLNKIETYGFRGEALGAICAVADLVITTRSSEESIGYLVNYAHDGQVISTKPCPCAQGTTISVLNLFKNIPVRRQYYRTEKNKKDDLRKVEDLLVSYGCIQNDVRFALYHNKNLIWQKPALSSTKNALIHVLGNSVVQHFNYAEHTDEQTQRKIEMYLPKLGAPLTCGLSSSSRCIVAINHRPVRIKSIDKLLKDYYNKAIQNCGKYRYPICYISFTTLLTEVDVNVEPNKTVVMLNHSEEILEQFSELLSKFYHVDVVGDSVNILHPGNLSPEQEVRSNTTDFINSLKVTCDTKLLQSKLTGINGMSSLEEDCLKKNSLNISNNHSLNDSDDPLTKKDIIEVSSSKEPCKKKLKTSSHSSKKDIESHISTLKDFFTLEEQTGGEKLSDISPHFNNIPTVTVQRVCPDSNDSNSPEIIKVVNGVDTSKSMAFAINSNICSNKSSEESDFADNRKQSSSDSSIPSDKLKDDFVKRPTVSVNGQNGEMWSHGVHLSGELIQPVAVLQPKSISALESSIKRPDNNNSNKKELPIATFGMKKSENGNSNRKGLNVEGNVSSERKLTGFDVYCRNNRLEVAAQNPEFNNQQIAQVLSERWNRLSTEEKSVYKSLLDKDYKRDIKMKDRLGKTISQNLSEDKKDTESPSKREKIKFKTKMKNKEISCSVEKIKSFYLSKNRIKPQCENLNLMNYLAPGIWICARKEKLYLLNTFRLQETIIYHRLLETYHFDTEPLETSQMILTSYIGEDAMAVLLQMSNSGININEKLSDKRLLANGFDIKIMRDDHNEVSFELIGIAASIAFYGISDLKELLLIIKEKGFATKLSLCRPSKIVLYLQSEANRMCRQSPPCQRLQDVEDLLNQKKHLPGDCNVCIHHKPFFSEIWKLNSTA